MMKLNPTRLSWLAPTEHEDGTPIIDPLSYELEVNGEGIAAFPGTLNPAGEFEALFEDLPQISGEATLTLRAFYQNNPARKSGPSNAIQVAFFPNPKAPTSLRAE